MRRWGRARPTRKAARPAAGGRTPASGADGQPGAFADLLATVPRAGDQRDWPAAGPAVRASLARHAAAAGRSALAGLVAEEGFLAIADPAGLAPVLGEVALAERDIVRAYRRVRPLLGDDPRANVAYLREARCGLTGAPDSPDGDGVIQPLYRTVLAAWRRDDCLVALEGHTNLVNLVTFGTAPGRGDTGGGRLLLASASDDGTVRVWDPLAGELACPPITGHTDEVWAVAFGNQTGAGGGRLLLASASKDTTVRVWDPLTGDPVIAPITGHSERVYSVTFGTLPDGRVLLASGSGDNTARVWDPLTGDQVGDPFGGHAGRVRSVAFGAVPGNGEAGGGRLLLASGSPDGPVWIRDPLTGEPVTEPITGDAGRVYWVGFCTGPDDRLLLMAGGVDWVMRFWDPLTGVAVDEPFPMMTGPVNCLAFGADGDGRRLLACTSGDATTHVWDPRDGTSEVATLVSHTGRVEGLAFGREPGGRLLLASASGDRTIRIWDKFVSAPDNPATSAWAWVSALAFATVAADGEAGGARLLLGVASGQKAVTVWDARSGVPVGAPVTGQAGWVSTLAFGTVPADGVAGGGRLLLAMACGDKVSGDTTVGVWDPLTGERVAGPLAGHTDAVRSVAFAPGPVAGGTGWPLLASASDDGTVRIWDPRAGAPVGHPIAAHTGGADAVAFGRGPDGRLLLASGGGDRAVRLWDPQTCEPASKPLTGHTGRVQSVALHTRGSRVVAASAGDDQTIRLWAPFSRRPARKTLTGHSGWVSSVAFGSVTRDGAAGEGRLLVFSGGGDRTVRVWDAASGACVVSLQRESIVRALAVSGRMVAVGQEEGFSVLELDRTVFR